MSAISSSAQSVEAGSGEAAPAAIPSAEIDASCRAPVLILFVSAALWLFAGSILGMVATLKLHQPNILADHAWLTYGRVHPAHLNAFIYGFAAQAGLGAALWMISHLGRTRLAFALGIIVGTILWNLGVTVGILGILYGESTGYEWLEMPRYASLTLFFAYLVIGLGAMLTFHARRERELYISQWFLLAALFWFPWIYSTGEFLLVAKPVRGTLQAAIDWWYQNNLMTVWLGFLGLAAIFYFIPKITRRPLYSHYLGIFIFWTLGMFGSWGGIPAGTPLPSWLPAMSTMAAVLTIIPVLAVAINVKRTFAGDCASVRESTPLKFILFGAMAYVVAALAGALASIDTVSEITNFTWFVPAQTQGFLYGFFAMSMFGAVYYIVPRLLQTGFCSEARIRWHFRLGMLGIVLYSGPLAFGGIMEGFALNHGKDSFFDAMRSALVFYMVSTTGELLMAVASLLFLWNLLGVLVRLGREATAAAWAANKKMAEVVS